MRPSAPPPPVFSSGDWLVSTQNGLLGVCLGTSWAWWEHGTVPRVPRLLPLYTSLPRGPSGYRRCSRGFSRGVSLSVLNRPSPGEGRTRGWGSEKTRLCVGLRAAGGHGCCFKSPDGPAICGNVGGPKGVPLSERRRQRKTHTVRARSDVASPTPNSDEGIGLVGTRGGL